MWFIWLALALTLLVAVGLYVRRRLLAALEALGVGRRAQRIAGYTLLWLLYGYPVVAFATVGITLIGGGEQMGPPEHPLVAWGLIVPFFVAALVVAQASPYLFAIDAVSYLWRRCTRSPPTMWRSRALATLAPLGVFALYTPGRILLEHGDLRWRHYTIAIAAPTANAAPAATRPPPFRIGFVADIQQDAYYDADRAREVLARLGAGQLDVVLSGGDWINMGPDHIERAADTAASVKSRLGTFTVRGDHEYFAYFDRKRSAAAVTAAMQARGVEMIHNEVRRFTHHGRSIAVAFLTNSYPEPTSLAELDRLIAAIEGDDASILVTHQLSAAVADRARDRVDLVLAAHTHGGQVNPVLGVWHAPVARIETPYVDGRYTLGKTMILVTAGLGYSIVPFRYASPASIELVELQFD